MPGNRNVAWWEWSPWVCLNRVEIDALETSEIPGGIKEDDKSNGAPTLRLCNLPLNQETKR